MARQVIDTTTNHGSYIGDPGKTAFEKVNANFDEIYGRVQPIELGGTGGKNVAEALDKLGLTGFYKKSNVLGPVGQSAGVPTGAVIERGSNSNGEYVRFADGTQICFGTYNSATANNASGGLYFSGLLTIGFAATFSNTPVISASTTAQTVALSWVGYPATANNNVGYLSLISTGSNATASIRWVAIGRWY